MPFDLTSPKATILKTGSWKRKLPEEILESFFIPLDEAVFLPVDIFPPDRMDSYGCEIALSNKFPGKLWRMVNNCKTGAICWGQGGQTIIIHQIKFQSEFLDPPNSIFKTTNIGSFIRQLNLYGFRKLNVVRYADSGAELREVHEFQNDFFTRGHPELLSRLRRNVGIRRSREMAVKRQLDEIHNYSEKKQRLLEMQGTQYLSVPPNYFNKSHDLSSSSSSSESSNSSITYQTTTQTGQWPVYMHWDGQSFKYVVLPDSSQSQHRYQQTTLSQPIMQTRKASNGDTFQVLHMPDTAAGGPTDEYYLLSLVGEDMSMQQASYSNVLPQEPTSPVHATPASANNQNCEYSPSELYKLAELLASDRQCAIAAAQQLLAQMQEHPAQPTDKGDGANQYWSTPTVNTPTWTHQFHSFFNENNINMFPDSPIIKFEHEVDTVEPKVVVTSNEEIVKRPPVLQSLLRSPQSRQQSFAQQGIPLHTLDHSYQERPPTFYNC